MLLIKTYLAPSSIDGVGTFSSEFVPKGTKVWEWHEDVDQMIDEWLVVTLPTVCQEVIKKYAWKQYGCYYLCADNDRFLNHSKDPNCLTCDNHIDIAARDIQIGEELTVDYSKFDPFFNDHDWVTDDLR